MIRYRPDNSASAAEASRQVGEAELTPRPMATPKLTRMNDIAPDANAPAMTELHWMLRGCSAAMKPPSKTLSCMRVSIAMAGLSAQAEERQDRHDHDDQADQIDQSVHSPILLKHSGALMRGIEER